MKKQLLFLGALLVMLAFTSCKKEETKPEDTTPTPTPTPSGFTPPTTNYWKIDTVTNSESADAFQVNLGGTQGGLSKPFNYFGYCQINIQGDDWDNTTNTAIDIRSKVAEGSYIEYNLSNVQSLGYVPTGDSLSINLTLTEGGEYYYFICQGGKIYISKKNGKLRYTTKGVINMTGAKNGAINNFAYSKTVDFTWEEL